MHTNEFILMNIHEDEYFWIMVVKTLICDLRNKKTDSKQHLKPAPGAKSYRCPCSAALRSTVAAAILQAYAYNLANAGGFEGCYLRNRRGFVRHQHVDIGRGSVLEAGVNSQLARVG